MGPTEFLHSEGKTNKAIVLFHGYGADMNDLAPLRQWLDPKGEWHWYFPNGPVRVPFGDMWEGRAWFPIDMAELEQAMRENRFRSFAGPATEAFDGAVRGMEAFLAPLAQKHPDLVIGGFSQGAMGVSHVALRGNVPVKGFVLLSGTLVDEAALVASPLTQSLSFFQSHGESDPLLSFPAAKALNALLGQRGHSGVWYPFRGGHEIPPAVLQALQGFLGGILSV